VTDVGYIIAGYIAVVWAKQTVYGYSLCPCPSPRVPNLRMSSSNSDPHQSGQSVVLWSVTVTLRDT